jgi:hypothetical protein
MRWPRPHHCWAPLPHASGLSKRLSSLSTLSLPLALLLALRQSADVEHLYGHEQSKLPPPAIIVSLSCSSPCLQAAALLAASSQTSHRRPPCTRRVDRHCWQAKLRSHRPSLILWAPSVSPGHRGVFAIVRHSSSPGQPAAAGALCLPRPLARTWPGHIGPPRAKPSRPMDACGPIGACAALLRRRQPSSNRISVSSPALPCSLYKGKRRGTVGRKWEKGKGLHVELMTHVNSATQI